jgi:hypothetical protein
MSRGGSRYGAGRPSRNIRIESVPRLDVRALHRRGLLRGGLSFSWSWRSGRSVGVSVATDAVTLTYMRNDVPMEMTIYLEWTRCHYGGSRPWFNCPRCPSRVAILCMVSGGWACRHCMPVRYASQSEDVMGRAWRRTRKIRRRLVGGEGRPLGKPKDMRWATFFRIQDELAETELRRDTAFIASMLRMFPCPAAK